MCTTKFSDLECSQFSSLWRIESHTMIAKQDLTRPVNVLRLFGSSRRERLFRVIGPVRSLSTYWNCRWLYRRWRRPDHEIPTTNCKILSYHLWAIVPIVSPSARDRRVSTTTNSNLSFCKAPTPRPLFLRPLGYQWMPSPGEQWVCYRFDLDHFWLMENGIDYSWMWAKRQILGQYWIDLFDKTDYQRLLISSPSSMVEIGTWPTWSITFNPNRI